MATQNFGSSKKIHQRGMQAGVLQCCSGNRERWFVAVEEEARSAITT